MEFTWNRKLEIYRTMLLSRRLDERAWLLHRQNRIAFHISAIGHEAAQAGAGFALRRGEDWVAPYPRDLTLMLALGYSPYDFFLMLMGKRSGTDSGGRQMPGNWSFPPANVVSISGVAAAQMPHAVGIAQGIHMRREEKAVLASCGEGATSMGEWYEAVNWAAVQHLPVVFLVQNNGLALSTPQQQQMLRSPARKASGMGLPVEKVDGTDPFEVYHAIDRMLENARAGKGPGLVEALLVRIPPHSSDDDDHGYRLLAEVEKARRQDPLDLLQRKLLNEGVLNQDLIDELEANIQSEVDQAVQAADRAAYPVPEEAAGPLVALKEEESAPLEVGGSSGNEDFTLLQAIHHTLDQEMDKDKQVILLGMDIGVKGGVFRVTEGLLKKYGPDRVIDTPLSGAALVGVAIGLALSGFKPVCEVQFADFVHPAFNQIVNEAARIHYRSAGAWRVPLVIRVPYGGGMSGGLYHSQSVEAFFSHVPGLKVIVLSNPLYAAGLLRGALYELGPVVFLEPKKGYRQLVSQIVAGDDILHPRDVCITHTGKDVSVIAYGMMHTYVLQAAEALEAEGISVEVVDLRVLSPLDMAPILDSVHKTGRVLVVHEDNISGGFGAEVAARIAEFGFIGLDAPVRRLAGPDVPGVPFSPPMQDWYMLNREKIMKAIRSLVEY